MKLEYLNAQLIIRVIVEIIAIIYVLFRFARYFELRRNNNILGDVFVRWEHVSIIDKYHLREKWLGGSRLRIKRDPKRREIKFVHLMIIPALVLICSTVRYTEHIIMTVAFLLLMSFVKLIVDRLLKKRPVVTFINSVITIALTVVWVCLSVRSSYESIQLKLSFIIPAIIVILILLYSVARRRIASIIICGSIVAGETAIYFLSGNTSLGNGIPLCICGYMYVTLIIMQMIYNRKALKKITFIQ